MNFIGILSASELSCIGRMFANLQTRLELLFSEHPLGIICILIIGAIDLDPV